jgi:hypothetical protein
MVAGVHAAAQGWRWSYYALSISLTALTVLFIFRFEETKYIPPVTTEPSVATSAPEAHGDIARGHEVDQKEYAASGTAKSMQDAEVVPVLNSYWTRMRLITKTDESFIKILLAPFRVIFFPHILLTAITFSFAIA